MKLMVIQLSDLHFGAIDSAKIRETKYMVENCVFTEIKSAIEKFHPEHIAIVLNGDYVEGSVVNNENTHLEQSRNAVKELVIPLEKMLDDEGIEISARIAVPGNHDANRAGGIGSPEEIILCEDRLSSFYQMIKELNDEIESDIKYETPKSGPTILPLEDYNIVFWPIDSAFRCGAKLDNQNAPTKKTAKSHQAKTKTTGGKVASDQLNEHLVVRSRKMDYIRIAEEAFDEFTEIIDEKLENFRFKESDPTEEKDTVKFAIVHHNPIATTVREEPHIYENEGEFMDFLLNHKFQFLLHGHNHETSALHIEEIKGYKGENKNSSIEAATPHLESGILCIGARAMWPHDQSERGFNIITLRTNEPSYLMTAKIGEVAISADRLATGNRRRTSHLEKMGFSISSRSLSLLPDRDRRVKSLLRLTRKIYSDTPISEFDRNAKLSDSAIHNLARSKSAYSSSNNIFAVYATNNLHPGDWLNTGFMDVIAPFAHIANSRAIFHAIQSNREKLKIEKKYDYTIPMFKFSDWLADTITACCERAKELEITELAKKLLEEESFKDEVTPTLNTGQAGYIQRMLNQFDEFQAEEKPEISSLSIWAPSYKNKPLTYAAHEFSIADTPINSPEAKKAAKNIFEFPRLLIWPIEHFFQPSAFEVIHFHETNGLPLFWLDPNRLKNSEGDLRANIGMSEFFGTNEELGIIHLTSFNNKLGINPSENEYLTPDASFEQLPNRLWGQKEGWTSLGPKKFLHPSPAQEFKILCSRPDILLAIDVWAIVHSREVEKLQEFQSKTDRECKTWLG